MLIWIVEDSKPVRALMASQIRSAGVQSTVESFESAQPVLDRMSAASPLVPDIIFLDVGLPDMDGIELCKHVRSRLGGGSHYLPYIIVFTGELESETVERAIEAGANDYMTKPLNVRIFRTRLTVGQRLAKEARVQQATDYLKSMTLYGMHHSVTPLAMCEVANGALNICYANPAMGTLCDTMPDDLLDISLTELQSWNQGYLQKVVHRLLAGEDFKGALVSDASHWGNMSLLNIMDPIISPQGGMSHVLIRQRALSANASAEGDLNPIAA